MGYPSSTLLVGSCEPFSGKSALVMGLVQQFRHKGVPLRYGKPLATSLEHQGEAPGPLIDDDVRFLGEIFDLPLGSLLPSLRPLPLLRPWASCVPGRRCQRSRLAWSSSSCWLRPRG